MDNLPADPEQLFLPEQMYGNDGASLENPFGFLGYLALDSRISETSPQTPLNLRIPFGPNVVDSSQVFVKPINDASTTIKTFKTPTTDNNGTIILVPDTSTTVDD